MTSNVWELGDYQKIARHLVFACELLAEDLEPCVGQKGLDIGTGNGNLALSFGRRGCQMIGIDPAKKLLEEGKKRAKAEKVAILFENQRAEQLPYEDESFDFVVSSFALEFSLDCNLAIKEMMRVLKPGGKMGILDWCYSGYIINFNAIVQKFLKLPLTVPDHYALGDKKEVKMLFQPYIRQFSFLQRSVSFRFVNAQQLIDHYRSYFGPTILLFNSFNFKKQKKLEAVLVETLKEFNESKDLNCFLLRQNYLQTIGIKK